MNIETQDAENNIIKHIDKQFNEIDSNGAWAIFYQHIRNESNNYEYSYEASKKPENKNLNRYRDVNPYDHSRVVLVKGASEQDRQRSDYINASLVRMPNAHRQYILAQGPLPNTTEHFWLMVWEQNCKAVIMLNRVIEKNQVKCHQYWPLGGTGNTEMLLPSIRLKVEYISETNVNYYTTRVLRLTDLDSGDSREILHFHYTTWPDFGVPQSPMAFLHFLMVVRRSGALDENVGPPVVHCSAGIGRSGTFCLVDSCLVLMEDGHEAVNVRDVLMEMRRHRMGLIQTPDQLRFSYLAILEGARRLLSREPGSVDLELFNANHLSNEEEEEEAPPPRPPPRGESLMARSTELESNHVSEGAPPVVPPLVLPEILPELPPDRPLPCEPGGPDRPLPSAPGGDTSDEEEEEEEEDEEQEDEGREEATSSGGESFQSSNTGDNSKPHQENEASEMRRRKRQERIERTTEQVRDIKRKQQETEAWQELKRLNKRQKRSQE